MFTLFRDAANLDMGGRAMDAGCGNGRNSVYLSDMGWEVTAVDASPVAARLAREASLNCGFDELIQVQEAVLQGVWDDDDSTYDLVVDSYVLCHYSEKAFTQNHLRQMARVLKPSGLAFTAFFSTDDEYYQKVGQTIDPSCNLVVDPNNNVQKRLYSTTELKSFLSSTFEIKCFVDFRFDDTCLGQVYERSILGALLSHK